jgi:hypothetical protein
MKTITECLYSELELRNNFSVDDLSAIYTDAHDLYYELSYYMSLVDKVRKSKLSKTDEATTDEL